jgi:iron complex transport system substrate-binding protein
MRPSALLHALLLSALGFAAARADAALPRVASINLCADQLVLEVAAPEQIVTLSWLASDPEESALAALAAHYPRNYGAAEELLRFAPDVVIAGTYTASYAREVLERLGFAVVELPPAETVAAIERNVRTVAAALERRERGTEVVAAIETALARSREHAPSRAITAIVLRPGSFTIGAGSLADELMGLAGLRNIAAEQGLDRWGSLSLESLLKAEPELLILTGYRRLEPSLANAALQHPALATLEARAATLTVPARLWACGLPQSLETVALMQDAARQIAP